MSEDWRKQAEAAKAAAAAGKTNQLAVVKSIERFLGTTANQEAATKALAELAKQCHLISPARVCPMLPEGNAVSFSMVLIDHEQRPDRSWGDVYPQAGKYALLKTALEKISIAAGIDWDPVLSGRTDDGGDARYYAWRVVARVKQLDGQIITLSAHKELDLRPDSPTAVALMDECIAKAVKEWTAKKDKPANWKTLAEEEGTLHGENRLRSLSLHAMRMVESKAKHALIRQLGIRAAYTAQELDLPFVVARHQWTGQTTDPELRRMQFQHSMEQASGGNRRAYGGEGAPRVYDVPKGSARVVEAPEPDGPEDVVPPDEPPETPQERPDATPPDDAPGEPPAQPGASGEAGEAPETPSAGDGAKGGLPPLGADAPDFDWKGKPMAISAGKGLGQVPIVECVDREQLEYWFGRLKTEWNEGKVEPKFKAYSAAKLLALEYQLMRLPPW